MRTMARPPAIVRAPDFLPLSRATGANRARAAIAFSDAGAGRREAVRAGAPHGLFGVLAAATGVGGLLNVR